MGQIKWSLEELLTPNQAFESHEKRWSVVKHVATFSLLLSYLWKPTNVGTDLQIEDASVDTN